MELSRRSPSSSQSMTDVTANVYSWPGVRLSTVIRVSVHASVSISRLSFLSELTADISTAYFLAGNTGFVHSRVINVSVLAEQCRDDTTESEVEIEVRRQTLN